MPSDVGILQALSLWQGNTRIAPAAPTFVGCRQVHMPAADMCLLDVVRLFMDGQFFDEVLTPTIALLYAWLDTEEKEDVDLAKMEKFYFSSIHDRLWKLGRLSIAFFRHSTLYSNLVNCLTLTRLPVHSRAGCAFACTISTNHMGGISSCLRCVTLQRSILVASILFQSNPLQCTLWYLIQ